MIQQSRDAVRPAKGRPRVAVCISGEFRHVHHRTPEHHVRHLKSFLFGVDCDVFVHGWSNSCEALILAELKPRAYLFEPRPDLSRLAERIRLVEPNIKPGRDHGSLSMFYALQRCFELLEAQGTEYDYVVRIRPDLYIDSSLHDVISAIENNNRLPGTIYLPDLFHSKGINDQLAIGSPAEMKIYAATFAYIQRNVERLFFNPEAVLLRHLIEAGIGLALVPMPYALMREVPIRINTVHETMLRQQGIWWSRTEQLPCFQDITRYFAGKLRAMQDAMEGKVPPLLYLRVPLTSAPGRMAIIRTRAADNDPVRNIIFLFRRWMLWWIAPGLLDGEGASLGEPGPRQTFVFRNGDGFTVQEWRMIDGMLVDTELDVAAEDASPVARRLGVRMSIAFWLERHFARRAMVRQGETIRQ